MLHSDKVCERVSVSYTHQEALYFFGIGCHETKNGRVLIVKQDEHHMDGGGEGIVNDLWEKFPSGAGKAENAVDGFGNLKYAGGVGPGMAFHNYGAIIRLERILDRIQSGRKVGAGVQAISGPGGNRE